MGRPVEGDDLVPHRHLWPELIDLCTDVGALRHERQVRNLPRRRHRTRKTYFCVVTASASSYPVTATTSRCGRRHTGPTPPGTRSRGGQGSSTRLRSAKKSACPNWLNAIRLTAVWLGSPMARDIRPRPLARSVILKRSASLRRDASDHTRNRTSKRRKLVGVRFDAGSADNGLVSHMKHLSAIRHRCAL